MKKYIIFAPLIALVFSLIGHIGQYKFYKVQLDQYSEQQTPEVDCYYKYYTDIEKHEFFIENVGLVNCKNVWAEEKIYLIHNDEVYEGTDIPHYQYILFNGSRTKMWDIERGSQIIIKLANHQIQAFNILWEKFKSPIISKWIVSYSSSKNSKSYKFEKHFIYDINERIFIEINNYVGGLKYLNKVHDYISSGTKKSINIFDLTSDFEIDAPRIFLINLDYSITPLTTWSKVSIEDFNNSRMLFFNMSSDIQISDDSKKGSIWYDWEFIQGKWKKQVSLSGGAKFYSKPFKTPYGYLSKKEAELVKKNAGMLKYNRVRHPPKENNKVIFERARIKYLKDRKK